MRFIKTNYLLISTGWKGEKGREQERLADSERNSLNAKRWENVKSISPQMNFIKFTRLLHEWNETRAKIVFSDSLYHYSRLGGHGKQSIDEFKAPHSVRVHSTWLIRSWTRSVVIDVFVPFCCPETHRFERRRHSVVIRRCSMKRRLEGAKSVSSL